jgi:hypothetical protein
VPYNDLRYYIFKVRNAVPISEKTKRKAVELAAGITSITIRCRLKEIGKYFDSLP